jgi:hypothetical protein
MKHNPPPKLLSVPLVIWGLQLLYVALALIIFIYLRSVLSVASQLSFQIGYVLAMLLIDVVWRIAIRKKKPDWF